MKPFIRMIEAMDDRLNPIAVKELRQAVQSRFVTGMLILLLLALLIAMTAMAQKGAMTGKWDNSRPCHPPRGDKKRSYSWAPAPP